MTLKLNRFFLLVLLALGITNLSWAQTRSELEARLKVAKEEERVDVLNLLSQLYIEEAAQDSGRQQADEAVSLALKLDYQVGLAEAYYSLGKYHAFNSDFTPALKEYQKSIEINKEIGSKQGLIKPYSDLSYIYSELGNYSKALDYALDAVRLIDETGDQKSDLSKILDEISVIYQGLGDFEKAKDYALNALEADSVYGDRADYALGLNNLGEIYKAEGDYVKALSLYQRALSIFSKSETKPGLVRYIYSSIGEVLTSQGDPVEAIEYLNKALEMDQEYSDQEGIIYNSGLLSEAYLESSQTEKALEYAWQSAQLAESVGFKDLLRDSYRQLAAAYAAKGNFVQAFEYEKRYADLSEQLYQENATLQIAEMQAEYDLEKVERENLQLREKSKITEAKNTIQRTFFILLSFFGAGLVLLLYVRFRDKSLANKVLESQKAQIERQNKDLAELNAVTQAQNEEIARAKNSIEAQNKALAIKNEEIQRKQNELQKTYQDLNYSHSKLKETNIDLAATAAALDESNQKLNQSYGKITSSITYAKRIQDAMLPNSEAFESAFSEFFIFYRPKDIVSGDFYWLAEVGDKVVVVAADCTGHGVPGAIMSMAGNAYLNQIVLSQRITDPAEILKALHSNISTALRQKQTENKDGMDTSICVFDRTQQVVRFAGAKNPVVYVQKQVYHHIKGDRAMIGGIRDKASNRFTTHEIKVDCPTKFYLYSDGYQDQFGGIKNTKFLSKRFRNLLFSTSNMPMSAQCERIETTFDEWRGKNKQLDDVLVLGLTIEP